MLTNAFSCLALLEDETSQLFNLLTERSENTQVRLLLNLLLLQTEMHRELLNELGRNSGNETLSSVTDCEKELGALFTAALKLTQSAKQDVKVDYLSSKLLESS